MIRLLRQFVVGQGGMQALQAFNGLLLVWLLPIPDFAVYAVFTAAMGFSSQMIGFGLGPTLSACVGARFENPTIVGRYLRAAFRLRLWTLAIISPVGIGLLIYSGLKTESSTTSLTLLSICLLAANYLRAQTDLFQTPLKMHRKLDRLYRWTIAAELLRLALFALAYFGGVLDVMTAALITVAGLALNTYGAYKEGRVLFCYPADPCAAERRHLLHLTLPTLPNVIFGAFQGQIVIFMAALFGTTTQMAAVGALGRLARILTFLKASNNMILGPEVAKQAPEIFWKRVPIILGIAFGLAGAISVSGFLFPETLVYVLGGKYQELSAVVWLVTLNAGLGYLTNVVGTLRSFRRWIAWWASFATIAAILVAQTIVINLAPLDTLLGILLLDTAASIGRLSMSFFTMATARFKPEWLRSIQSAESVAPTRT